MKQNQAEFRRPMPENFAETFVQHGHDRILMSIFSPRHIPPPQNDNRG